MHMQTMTFNEAMLARATWPDKYLFVSTVARQPNYFQADFEWVTVAPIWETMVAPYKKGEMGEGEYCELYTEMLSERAHTILHEWYEIEKRCEELNRIPVILCFDKLFCHRFQLMGFLKGLASGYGLGIDFIACGE